MTDGGAGAKRYNGAVLPLPAELLAALPVGVATVDSAGGLVAANAAMVRLLAGGAASFAGLGLDADAIERLSAGEVVEFDRAGSHWSLRHGRAEDGGAWLVAEDVTAAHRAASATFELARLRAMARVAATLVHDFNNLLNSAIGLLAQTEMSVSDPMQRDLARELGGAVQQGAQLARTIARLLARGIGERATVPARQLLDEAVAVTQKAAAHRGVQLAVTVADDAPVVRTVVAEAVQALWQTLLALLDHGPRRIAIGLGAAEVALAGGRPRACARMRIDVAGLVPAAATECERLVNAAPGLLRLLGTSPPANGFVLAAIVLIRLGGEMVARCRGDDLQIDCVLPAAR